MRTRLRRARLIGSKRTVDSGAAPIAADGNAPVLADLNANVEALRRLMEQSSDLITRKLLIGGSTEAVVVYLIGMADVQLIQDAIIRPLMSVELPPGVPTIDPVETQIVTAAGSKRVASIESLAAEVIAGKTGVLVAGLTLALSINTEGWAKRSVEESRSEVVIRGPRESFTETLQDSIALVRRRVRDPNLAVELMSAGKRTQTSIAVLYLKGVADDAVVGEVRARIKRIDADAVLESAYVEQFIEDQTFTPFPTVAFTERPDVTAARILEGRVGILVDGSPEALTVPHLYVENFQSPEDYYSRVYYANLVRFFRYLAFSISLIAPSVYVALTTYHQQLIPTQLLFTIASAQEGTPFPTAVEVVGLGLVFELLREGGIRLPEPIGQAVSIVGVLVIGQAAVSAGVVDAPVVILVSMTAIASFLNPRLTEAALIGRLFLTVLAAVLGGYGLVLGMIAMLAHVASLRSFGAPYLAPVMPVSPRALIQDALLRAPIWAMNKRPQQIAGQDSTRQAQGLRPQPPARKGRVKRK